MNTARIVVLTIAVGAGGVAAYLASGSDPKQSPTEPVVHLQTVDVLVAKNDIGLGKSVTADDLQWQTWPAATASKSFIRPNDRVDVILSKREKNPDQRGAPDIVNSEVILSNIRVLAIDQAPKEKDGQTAVVGKTVTLELKPEQTETLARARQSGTLSLALRSIADVNAPDRVDDRIKRSDSINVVRYGVPSPTTTQK